VNGRRTRTRVKELEGPSISQEIRPWLATDKQQQLFSSYPLFFRSVQYPGAYPSNLAFFGIQCGLGWYPIIEAAAQDIEEQLQAMWCDQATTFLDNVAAIDHKLLLGQSLSEVLFPVLPFCSEIRETRGRLRISITSGYICTGWSWMCIRESANRAEALAQTVCERCGKPGELRRGYWEHVYCAECIRPVPTNE
jgi:hypothetical protein